MPTLRGNQAVGLLRGQDVSHSLGDGVAIRTLARNVAGGQKRQDRQTRDGRVVLGGPCDSPGAVLFLHALEERQGAIDVVVHAPRGRGLGTGQDGRQRETNQGEEDRPVAVYVSRTPGTRNVNGVGLIPSGLPLLRRAGQLLKIGAESTPHSPRRSAAANPATTAFAIPRATRPTICRRTSETPCRSVPDSAALPATPPKSSTVCYRSVVPRTAGPSGQLLAGLIGCPLHACAACCMEICAWGT